MEVSLILRGNWSLPTVHMGSPHIWGDPIPVVGEGWKGGGSSSTSLPPPKWGGIPFQRWERTSSPTAGMGLSHSSGGRGVEGHGLNIIIL